MTWNTTVNDHMVNQLILGGFYYSSIFKVTHDAQAEALFPTTLRCVANRLWGVPTAANYPIIGGEQFNNPQGRRVAQAQLIDDFSWTKGNHNLMGVYVPKTRNDVLAGDVDALGV